MDAEKLKSYITDIKDFPEKGVIFRDITTLMENPEGLKLTLQTMEEKVADLDFDLVIGSEARGFLLGVPIAHDRGKGFVMARKKNKLPRKTISVDYELEYGDISTLEVHEDSIKKGQKVLIVDDLIATGGTIKAMIELVEKCGGIVAGICVLIELSYLNGRDMLKDYRVDSCIVYDN